METCFPVLSVTLPSNFRVQRGRVLLWRITSACWRGQQGEERSVGPAWMSCRRRLRMIESARLFPEQSQHSYWTNRIANLIFLTKRINTRASNWDFDKKKKGVLCFKGGTSPFPLTQSVLRTEKRSVEHLIDRQAHLVYETQTAMETRTETGITATRPRGPGAPAVRQLSPDDHAHA